MNLPAPRRAWISRLFAVLLLFTATAGAAPETAVYMQFSDGTGQWAGESVVKGREGWTEVKEIAFGAETTVDFSEGNVRVGRAQFHKIVVKKNIDRLSPRIFTAMAGATSLPVATIEFTKPNREGTPVVYLRLELKTAYFSKQSAAQAGGSDAAEEILLECVAMRTTCWPLDSFGNPGTPVSGAWNRVTNAPSF